MNKIKQTKEQKYLIDTVLKCGYTQVFMSKSMHISKGQLNKVLKGRIPFTAKMQWSIRQFCDKYVYIM